MLKPASSVCISTSPLLLIKTRPVQAILSGLVTAVVNRRGFRDQVQILEHTHTFKATNFFDSDEDTLGIRTLVFY